MEYQEIEAQSIQEIELLEQEINSCNEKSIVLEKEKLQVKIDLQDLYDHAYESGREPEKFIVRQKYARLEILTDRIAIIEKDRKLASFKIDSIRKNLSMIRRQFHMQKQLTEEERQEKESQKNIKTRFIGSFFIEKCKHILPESTFNAIFSEAKQEYEKHQSQDNEKI